MKDMQEEIRKVSERAELLQVREAYNEQDVVCDIFDVLAKYGLSLKDLKVLLAKTFAPDCAVMKIETAAKILGVSANWLRTAVQHKEFSSWSKAIKINDKTYRYIILKNKFEEFAGVKVDEYLQGLR